MEEDSSWDLLSQRWADAGQPSQPGRSVPSKKETRGRPKGTLGNSISRAYLKSQQQHALPRELGRAVVRHQNQHVVPTDESGLVPMTSFTQMVSSERLGSSVLQKKVCLFAAQQSVQSQLAGEENPAEKYLFSGQRPVSTLSALIGGKPSSTDAAIPRRMASVLVESSGHLWNCMLSHILDLIDNHSYKPLVIGRRRRYDETPYRLRIKEDDAIEGQRAHPAIVKTLQTQFAFFTLLYNPDTDS